MEQNRARMCISVNWRGWPLESLLVIIDLIASTTTGTRRPSLSRAMHRLPSSACARL
jgi:hypothetical protein